MNRMFRLVLIVIFLSFVTRAAVASTGIMNPKVRWKFKTQGPIRGQAVVDATRIYFGSADGYFYALDKKDGKLLWKFSAQGAITSAPALSESMVVVISADNIIYALNTSTGQIVWKFQMQSLLTAYWEWDYFSASPAIADGKVYVGSADGNLYVLDMRQGKMLWKFTTRGRIRATPGITKDIIYVASNDGKVYAVSNKDGKLLWEFATDGAAYDSRKFGWDRNSIYAAPLIQDSLLVVASRDGKTYAVNVNTHKQKWSFTYGPTWAMSASMENNVVYTGWSDNSLLSAVDLLTGKEKWKFQSGSLVYTKPFLTDHEVLIGSADEKIYCLAKANGNKLWEYKTGGCVYSSPVVDSNIVFAGSDDGYMYALEEGMKPIKAVYQPIAANAMMEGFTVDKKILPYLKERGFEQLDSAKLYHFLNDRIRDGTPSVIVFSYDQIPASMVGVDPQQGMIRKYLEAGGKIIWFGNVPNLYTFDSKGKPTMDTSVASRMLDIKVIRPEESGNYYSQTTQAGMNMGLPAWKTFTYANIDNERVLPLAIDDHGRVTAWMKKFNARAGSGFISCRTLGWYAPIHDEDLRLVHTLALHELE